ncbi:hypothetical protein [Microcoleus sp. B3-D7]|uniref:hypothetical protein n=1 Tax=Microcoleus sp. B3-D7 TaxID=2818659 RepID=UPI002FD11356
MPAWNADRLDLEIAGEIGLAIGGFIISPIVVQESGGYKIVVGYGQYQASVLARQLNPGVPTKQFRPSNSQKIKPHL